MAFQSKRSRIFLFFAIGFGMALLASLLKSAIAWIADIYVYSLPWVGGFLRSVELAELSNLLAFALLGIGIGSASYFLPRRWNHKAKLALLIFLSPFVFSASYLTQQNLWIRKVAARSNMSYQDARNLTNRFLERETGNGGYFGYFPVSTRLVDLPIQPDILNSEVAVIPGDVLTEALDSYDDIGSNAVVFLFKQVGWLIRFMYIIMAGLTGLIYYFKGCDWAEDTHQRATGNTHPTATRKPKAP
ncbi:hypothetical protein [cf. Phormidesmis sp. LEGE 11477]|uniref:hypothetical protein n=1 Tax=cf. Phormidesmis sp. LEGE 11477 TaxID=1828680 RepID=UPI0018810203|nr:hypothetical protein [cf. Phormidesmis sp. LEGE 11477]MBE9063985.1 hypothetical protein [cf. Phormidesmis sp. LEGE 11477]